MITLSPNSPIEDDNYYCQVITVEGKSSIEQLNLLKQLDEEDRTVVFKIIDTMLTKKKVKDFFQKNVATL